MHVPASFRPPIRVAAALAAMAGLLAFAPGAYGASTAEFRADELVVLSTDTPGAATGANNVVDVIRTSTTGTDVYRVTDETGMTALAGCTAVAGSTTAVDCTDPMPAATHRIRIAGYGGNDTLRAGFGQTAAAWGTADARIIGRQGVDTLIGSPASGDELEGGLGDDLVDGNDGNDFVSGAGEFSDGGGNVGNDRVYGGPGEDTVTDGEARNDVHDDDTLDGGVCTVAGCSGGTDGAGTDRLYLYNVPGRGEPRNAPITVNLATGTAGQPGESNRIANFEAVITGDGDDTVTGSAGNDRIFTRGGDDSVQSTDGVVDFIDCGDGAGDELRRDATDIDEAGRCEIEGPVGAPQGLTARLDGDRAVILSWRAISGARSYKVLRRPGNSLDGSPTGEALRVGGLNEGTRYCWVVRSVNSFGDSGDSPEICAVAGRSGGSVGGGAGGPSQRAVARASSTSAARAIRAIKKAGLRRLIRRGVSVKGIAPAAGRATFTLVGQARGARRVLVLRARKSSDEAGAYTIRLKGRRSAARRLRGVTRFRANLTVAFATDAGLNASVTRRFALKR